MRKLLIGPVLGLLGLATNVIAQEPGYAGADDSTYLPAPPPPPAAYPGEGIEPEVTITETESAVVYEYRIKGRLYMVKIDPLAGPPYFLFDTDGDGELDGQQESVGGPNLSVPQWVLFSW